MKMIDVYAFPENSEEAKAWKPLIFVVALASRVLAVAQTRCEGTWSAYCDAVPDQNHDHEFNIVLRNGAKLNEEIARTIFSVFKDLPYSR